MGSSATKDTTADVYDTTTGRILRVGDFSFGNINGTRLVSSLHDIKCTGFYSCLGAGSATPATGVPTGSGNTRFIVLANSVYVDQFWLTLISRDEFYTGLLNNATQTISWTKHYNTANTTKTSDGTLKAASPVARIVNSQEDCQRSDIDEPGFDWCGCGTANAEAEGINVLRLDTGVYLLSGAAGLASEGWQLLAPMDPGSMGELGVVEAEQTDGGNIIIRLYTRKYILSDEGEIVKTKGEPIDVPTNSWIDVRLDMPEDSVFKRKSFYITQK